MKQSIFFSTLMILVVVSNFLPAGAVRAAGQSEVSSYPPVLTSPVQPGAEVRDLVYCTNQVALKMDLYYPVSGKAPWPAILFVHGGAWVGGDKSIEYVSEEVDALRAAGYIVVAVDYRLAPDYAFPAMIVDLKCSVRFLRAHAEELQLDPENIGAWGNSAGGHLVSLLGLADKSAGWDRGEYEEQSSEIQAVVDMFGVTDMLRFPDEDRVHEMATILFGGVEPDRKMLAYASPISYISVGDPPFLIVHGKQDDVIPVSQALLLHQRLVFTGVPTHLTLIANAGHGLKAVGGRPKPARTQIIGSMVEFFDRYLNGWF